MSVKGANSRPANPSFASAVFGGVHGPGRERGGRTEPLTEGQSGPWAFFCEIN